MELKGSYVALVTPFNNGKLDIEAVKKLVKYHIDNNTAGIVPAGCTGEAATLSLEERQELIETVIETARGSNLQIIPGTGTNNTQTTITLSKMAENLGADAVMLITPYYNKPTQEGLYQHYKKVANSLSIPIILYNVPSRTGVSLSPQTIKKLAEIENIIGIKEASGSLDQVSAIVRSTKLTVLSGDDSLTLPMLSIGAKGVISVVANFIPSDVAEMINSFFNKDIEKAKNIHLKMFPLIKAMFCETNPAPVKKAMELLGLINGELRLPLVPVKKDSETLIKNELLNYGLMGG